MKKGLLLSIFLLFCVTMVPAIAPAQNVAVFQKKVSVTSHDNSLLLKGYAQSDDFREPNLFLQRYHSGRSIVNHISTIGAIPDGTKNFRFAVNEFFISLLFPGASSASDYLSHIYPSHNFW